MSNGKEHFGPTDENDQTGQSGPAGSEYSGRNKPRWSVPFDYQPKFPEFGVEWKAPLDREVDKLSGIQTVCDAGYKSVQKKLGSF